ncbi:molybdenum ABC transporter ATP-binding protein [Congregibacter litoralis]|uniref:Molybdenum ABC transporter, ATP-binding protein n=1 Tax=Congregibacter litoralis KT71 TaxID=314285 RepID=A4A8I7_9GAMM|nr:molybdenum ABC transporter ATP-binding protein [Congregibacter litoralis]EAQ97379.1 molybdenum ABC transporter, ATP-binding protein [Congregibacter litoralis KT71]
MTQLSLNIEHRDAEGFHLSIHTDLALTGVTALFGPSGSGKTTILDAIAGLRPDISDATIAFNGKNWQEGSQHTPPWKRSLSYVFQDARLFPHMTVAQNLAFAAKHATAAPDAEQIATAMDITALMERFPETLSAGQQARVAIARALMRDPDLLLLDEPLANLDRSAAAACLACLRRIHRERELPMIYVSHQIEELSTIADQILLIANGKVTEQGPLLELASQVNTALAEDESAASLLAVEVFAQDPEFGLTELRVDGQSLWVAGSEDRGNLRRLRVPARDVSVCRERPVDTSIQNVLPVTLLEIRELSKAHCLLRLQLKQQCLLARVTRRSREDLKLRPGDQLFAQIKSTALLGDAR